MMGTKATVCLRVRIEGRVQGVFFRVWTVEQAVERGLSGWVRNRRDNSVEALFCGAQVAVDDMLAACRHGPPKASVTAVIAEPADPPDVSRPGPTLA